MRATLKTLLPPILLIVSGAAQAAWQVQTVDAASGAIEGVERADLSATQRGCMSLDQAVEQVRRQYNGRIVSAKTEVRGGQETHVIKVLTDDGKVRTVQIPGCRRN